jgi:hypothetical protein
MIKTPVLWACRTFRTITHENPCFVNTLDLILERSWVQEQYNTELSKLPWFLNTPDFSTLLISQTPLNSQTPLIFKTPLLFQTPLISWALTETLKLMIRPFWKVNNSCCNFFNQILYQSQFGHFSYENRVIDVIRLGVKAVCLLYDISYLSTQVNLNWLDFNDW